MFDISIAGEDARAGSPKPGDMIARNPNNHKDQWLVAAQYFADNFEPIVTRAFDLALFVPVPANSGDGVVVDVLGPPYTTKFAPLVTGSGPGIVVGGSMPKANEQNQILISGPGPNYAWALGTNPAAAAAEAAGDRQPSDADERCFADLAGHHHRHRDGALGNAVTTTTGGDFTPSAQLTFQTTATPSVCIDGRVPTLSILDNFSCDAGEF